MINVVVGKPGQGKTYFLVTLAARYVNRGIDIYTNFHIDYDKLLGYLRKKNKYNIFRSKKKAYGRIFYWTKVNDLIPLKNGIVFMDECQIWLNSRKWASLPEALQYKLQQHRKHGLHIWGAVQNFKRIDTVARELVNSVYEVRKVGHFFLLKEFNPEDVDKAKRQNFGIKLFALNKKLANTYDTLQEVVKSF